MKLLQSIAIFLAVASSSTAAITNVAIVSTTATQALIQYTWTPSTDVCKVESSVNGPASLTPYLPLDNDVDPAQFTGSNLDSRPLAINNNGDRQFVIGLRGENLNAPTLSGTQTNLSGVPVSRALGASTVHYFRITCPSAGGSTATGSFETTTIPYGSLYADPPGNLFPSISTTQKFFATPPPLNLNSAFQAAGDGAVNRLTASSNGFTEAGTGSFTTFSFININTTSSLYVAIGACSPSTFPTGTSYQLYFSGGGGPHNFIFLTIDSGGTIAAANGATLPSTGVWNFIAGVHDATVPTARVDSIWVNGVVDGTASAGALNVRNEGDALGILGCAASPTWTVNGAIAMTGKVSAALNSTQINYLYNFGNGRTAAQVLAYFTAQSLPAPDLLYEYASSGALGTDSSGHGTTLTATGTVLQGIGPNTNLGTPNPINDPNTGIQWVGQLAVTSDTNGGPQTGATGAITWTDPDGTSWNNPTFITSGNPAGATSNSGTTGKLIGHYALQLPGGVFFNTSNNPYQGSVAIQSLLYQTVTVTALVSSGGSAPGQTINVCAFNLTQTDCDASSQIYPKILTTSSTPYTFGTGANGDMMRVTFGVGIPSWVAQAGNGINIAIWKPNASTDIVTILSVSVGWSFGSQQGGNDGGGYTGFSPALVTGPDCVSGVCEQGYVFNVNPLQYFIGLNSGRTHFEGSVNPRDCGVPLNTYYSQGSPLVLYCMDVGTGALYQMTQTPVNGSNPWNDYPPGGPFTDGNSFQNALCGSAPCIAKVTLTPSIPTLVQNFTAATLSHSPVVFDPTVFTEFISTGTNATSGEFIVAYLIPGSQFGQLWWAVVFDPAITSNASGGMSSGAAGNNGCIGGGNPGCVVAAAPVWAVDGAQWSTWKGLETFKGDPGGERWVTLITYFANPSLYSIQMVDGITNGDGSINALTGTAHSTCASPPAPLPGYGCDQITIQTNIPTPQGTGAFAYAPGSPLLVNSLLNLTGGQGQGTGTEVSRVLSITPSNTSGEWKVLIERGANNNSLQASGSLPQLYLQPAMNQNQETNPAPGGQGFWNYGNYPYGVDLSGNRQAIPANPFLTGCHTDYTNGGGIAGCTAAPSDTRFQSGSVTGFSNNQPVRTQITQSLSPSITNGEATFNADTWPSGGYHQSHFAGSYNAPIFGPGHPYLGWDGGGNNTCNIVTGTLCAYSTGPPPGVSLPFSKISPMAAYYGHIRLTNISGPGSVIDGTSVHLYQVCIAAVIGECFAGSAVGEVYINAPTTEANYFNFDLFVAQDAINCDNHTLVVRNTMPWFNGTTEIKFPTISNASGSRLLTNSQHLTFQSVFDNSQFTPDGKFVIVQMPQIGDGSAQNAWLVGKVPPEKDDNINRSTWWKQTINVPAVAGATSAYIRGGYAEFGNPASAQFFASERLENSVFTSGTTTTLGSSANPFWYETTESGSWSATSCTSGCTITLNIIPQRTMYYSIVWKNGATTIKTGPVTAVMSP